MKRVFGLLGSAFGIVALLAFGVVTSAPAQADSNKAAAAAVASAPASSAVDITIYGQQLAQVQETRTIKLNAGANKFQLDGIASGYLNDSLRIVSVTGPGTFKKSIATYQPANLTNERMLADSVGKDVEVFDKTSGTGQWVKGKLLSVSGGQLALEVNAGEVRLLSSAEVRLARPDGLASTASLVVEATATVAGDYKVTFMYETSGLGWSAKHTLVYDEDNSVLNSWETSVSITNNSGVSFQGATVRLISGKVLDKGFGARGLHAAPAGFAPQNDSENAMIETVGDQKTYNLAGKVSLVNGQSAQVSLFEAKDVPVVRQYFVPSFGGNASRQESVSVRLLVENTEKANMGKALPAGPVKVYQANAAGIQLQTGSASISDKAQDEKFDMVIGTASDIKYTRTLVETKRFNSAGEELTAPKAAPKGVRPVRVTPSVQPGQPVPANAADEPAREDQTWQVKIYNYKKDRKVHVKVEVAVGHAQPVEKPLIQKNANMAEANVTVPAGDKATLEYTLVINLK